jgi:anti-anti-sigma factor
LEVIVAETFHVDYANEDGTPVVRFIGELDMAVAPDAEQVGLAALWELNGDGSALVIDMTELAYCDSSGIRALLAIHKAAAASGHGVTLRNPSAIVRRVLALTGVCEVFALDGPPAFSG